MKFEFTTGGAAPSRYMARGTITNAGVTNLPVLHKELLEYR